MGKETKNLMNKLKDFEQALMDEVDQEKSNAYFLQNQSANCLPEKMTLRAANDVLYRLYYFFPEIKDYKKVE